MSSTCAGYSHWQRVAFVATVAGLGLGIFNIAARAQSRPSDSKEADQMFQSLDANRDGRLTMNEAGPNSRPMLARIFEMAGKPAMGTVSRSEFQQVFEEHRARSGENRDRSNGPATNRPSSPPKNRPGNDETTPVEAAGLPPILKQLDGNGDGRLSRSELQRLTQLFAQLDADQDGALTVDEMQGADRLPSGNDKSRDGGRTPRGVPSTVKSETDDSGARAGGRGNGTGNGAEGRSARGSIPAGVWRGWVVEGRGETPNSGQMEIELTVEGNRITGRELSTRRAPGGIGGGTFTSTGDGHTGNLDAEGISGPQEGRSFQGIYEYDGEVLKWCVSNRGRQRPQTMATDRGNYLMILRQQK